MKKLKNLLKKIKPKKHSLHKRKEKKYHDSSSI
jgi:hypothetical protein